MVELLATYLPFLLQWLVKCKAAGILKIGKSMDEPAHIRGKSGTIIVAWRTNRSAVPPPKECTCGNAMIVSALGLTMDELGLPWCPVIANLTLTFDGVNKLLRAADGPGRCFELSKWSLNGLTVRDIFLRERGECLQCFY